MRLRGKQIGALLAAAVLVSDPTGRMAAFAEDLLVDEGQGEAVDGGAVSGGAGSSSGVTLDGAPDDGGALIQDGGDTSVVQEGASLEDVEEAEKQAQAAKEQAELLLWNDALVLESASEDSLKTYWENLTAQPSPTGSDGELKIGQYIETVMKDLGYTVEEQSFHEGFLNEDYVDVPGVNIIAERGADSENRSKDILIVTAHYDSRTNPQEGDPLANDKSGAAVLLETARILSGIDSDLDVCFLFLSGEEDGLYGSTRFVEHLTQEQRDRVRGVICLGTVGMGSGVKYLLGTDDVLGNEPGRLLRAAALENEANRLLENAQSAGDGSFQEDGQQTEAQKGAWGTEEDAQGEAKSASRETESEEDAPGEWSFVTDTHDSRKAFAEADLAAVSLFQDVEGRYRETADPEGETKIQTGTEGDDAAAGETATEEILATEEESSAAVYRAEEETAGEDVRLPDWEEMQQVTDILARTVGAYMYANGLSQ